MPLRALVAICELTGGYVVRRAELVDQPERGRFKAAPVLILETMGVGIVALDMTEVEKAEPLERGTWERA